MTPATAPPLAPQMGPKKTSKAPAKKAGGGAKKAVSGYMLFCKEMRPKVKDELPDATFGELGKELGARARALGRGEGEVQVGGRPSLRRLGTRARRLHVPARAGFGRGGGGGTRQHEGTRGAAVRVHDKDAQYGANTRPRRARARARGLDRREAPARVEGRTRRVRQT